VHKPSQKKDENTRFQGFTTPCLQVGLRLDYLASPLEGIPSGSCQNIFLSSRSEESLASGSMALSVKVASR